MMEGVKYDKDKPRLDLIPWDAVVEIGKVVTFGSEKYEDENWKKVKPFRRRFFAACMRHLIAWICGEQLDPETGLNHLAHAGCCILFLLWGETNLPRGDK